MKAITRFICLIYLIGSIDLHGQTSEFVGPFESWSNLIKKYGARGDGRTDDTKAIQKALDELDQYNNPVLYIPAGEYIISQTLVLRSRVSVVITGDDPLKTIIRWNGTPGGTMLLVDGAGYCSYSRLTFDGGNKAGEGMLFQFDIRGTKKYANTSSDISDIIFKNLGFGIRTGALYPDGKYGQDAECMVNRCRFYDCTVAGIAVADWNDLDWYIWNSWFENCTLGVTNDALEGGAGNFHVYQSAFLGSKEADIKIGVVNPFSISWNKSRNSKQFIKVSRGWNTNGALVTLQGNIILNTKEVQALSLITKGNILMIDNYISNQKFSDKAPVLYKSDAEKNLPDLVSIANRYTSSKLYDMQSRYIQSDDKFVKTTSTVIEDFKPVPFLPMQKRMVFEVPREANATTIQEILDKAYTMKGKKPVVHFPYGVYRIEKTIKIREGADIQLIGDANFSSQLSWTGPSGGTILEIDIKSRAQLSNLYFRGYKKANLILVKDEDLGGNIFYAEQLTSNGSLETGIEVSGFSNTRFEILTFYQYENVKAGVTVTGSKGSRSSFVNIYGNCGGDNRPSFRINDKGNLMVREAWYESSTSMHYARVVGKGNFYLHGAQVAVSKQQGKELLFDLGDFDGKILASQTAFRFPSKGMQLMESTKKGKFLVIGCLYHGADSSYAVFQPRNTNTGFVNSRFVRRGSEPARNKGNSNVNFVKELLAPIRNNRPPQLNNNNTNSNLSRLCFYRVNLSEGITNLRFEHKRPKR